MDEQKTPQNGMFSTRVLRVRKAKLDQPEKVFEDATKKTPKPKKSERQILMARKMRAYKKRTRDPLKGETPGKYLRVRYNCDGCISGVTKAIFKKTKEATGKFSGFLTDVEKEKEPKRKGRVPQHIMSAPKILPFKNYDAHVIPSSLTKIQILNNRTTKLRAQQKGEKNKRKLVTKPTKTKTAMGLKKRPSMLPNRQRLITRLRMVPRDWQVVVLLVQLDYSSRATGSRLPNQHQLHTDVLVCFKPRRMIYYIAPKPLKRLRGDYEYREQNHGIVQLRVIQEIRNHLFGAREFGEERQIQLLTDVGGSCLFMALRGCSYLAENGMPDARDVRKLVYLREGEKNATESKTAFAKYYEELFDEEYQRCRDRKGDCNRYVE